jgi:FMN phosphatase YigB (HAD superfamily)
MKKLIVFDLDGTLAESKAPLDTEMAALLGEVLPLVRQLGGANKLRLRISLGSSVSDQLRYSLETFMIIA